MAPSASATVAGALEGGAVGQRVGIGQADLEEVGTAVDQGDGDRGRGLSVGIAGHGVGDERGATVVVGGGGWRP